MSQPSNPETRPAILYGASGAEGSEFLYASFRQSTIPEAQKLRVIEFWRQKILHEGKHFEKFEVEDCPTDSREQNKLFNELLSGNAEAVDEADSTDTAEVVVDLRDNTGPVAQGAGNLAERLRSMGKRPSPVPHHGH